MNSVALARLGVGPTNDPLGTFRVCACHKSFDAAEDSLHALSCGPNKGPRNTRHDAIRDMLYQLIKKLHPGIQQTHLTMECVVGQILTEGENPRNVRSTIAFSCDEYCSVRFCSVLVAVKNLSTTELAKCEPLSDRM
jgi:hypothetical protein